MTPSFPLDELLAGTTILRTRCLPESLAIPVYPWQLGSRFYFKLRAPSIRKSAARAILRGAQLVVLEDGDQEEVTLARDVPCLIVDNVNRAFARAASRIYGEVHHQLSLIGVAGEGRTTVCHLVEGALRASGIRSGLFSSLACRLVHSDRPAPGPANSAFLLHNFLLNFHRESGTHAVLEIGPADIAEERIFGLHFDVLAFTSSGQPGETDLLAMRRLFSDKFQKSPASLVALNGDDPMGRELARVTPGRVITFGFSSGDLAPEDYSSDESGITLRFHGREVRSPLIGRHGAINVMAAAAIVADVTQSEDACLHLGKVAPPPTGLRKLQATDGDVYFYSLGAPSAVSVQTVKLALAAVREIARSRRIVSLVVCSGMSDRATRAAIAKATISGSDFGILTTGDSGHEHPIAILLDMLQGVPQTGPARLKTIIDRRAAIAVAIGEALPDGIAVLFGDPIDRKVAIETLHELSATRANR